MALIKAAVAMGRTLHVEPPGDGGACPVLTDDIRVQGQGQTGFYAPTSVMTCNLVLQQIAYRPFAACLAMTRSSCSTNIGPALRLERESRSASARR